MSIHDERDLRVRLGTALDDLAPGPLPFDSVVRQGRAVVLRRRLTAAAVALAIVAAAVLVPTLLNALHRPAPIEQRYHVTVDAPGPGSPAGLVASGLVNRARWQLIAWTNAKHSRICIRSIRGTENCNFNAPVRGLAGPPASITPDSNNFARLRDGRGVHLQMVDGFVRHDVDHIRVALSNGQELTLHPVPVLGDRYARWVAFAVPFSAAVKEISVYSATAELEHTFPFTAGSDINIVRWLAPDQPGRPAPAVGQVGSGTTAGHHWVVTGYVGPWGSCFENATVGMDICSAQSAPLRRGVVVKRMVTSHYFDIHLGLSVLQVDPAVSYLLVTRAHSSALRLRSETLGGQKYCVLPYQDHNQDVAWTAYDAAGHLLDSGSVSGLLG
jgi:hypothetical protein